MLSPETMKLKTGEPVSFSFEGCRLFGMLSRPPAEALRRDTGIVILNPGPTDRNGPERLYFKLAELFAAEGYPVLRFDARGVGESEGECFVVLVGSLFSVVFTKIQTGIWVPDTEAAIDFMIARTGVKQVILGGLCGGAITALLAGAEHPKVIGQFMIGNPTTLSSKASEVQDLPESVLSRDAKLYWEKLFRPSAWLRVLTLKTDLRTFWKVALSRIRPRTQKEKANGSEAGSAKLNPFFVRSFHSAIAGGKKLLFVYSENDYLWHEYQEYFSPSLEKGSAGGFELATIPKANHNLTETDWQGALHKILIAWLGGFGDRVSRDRR